MNQKKNVWARIWKYFVISIYVSLIELYVGLDSPIFYYRDGILCGLFKLDCVFRGTKNIRMLNLWFTYYKVWIYLYISVGRRWTLIYQTVLITAEFWTLLEILTMLLCLFMDVSNFPDILIWSNWMSFSLVLLTFRPLCNLFFEAMALHYNF